MEITRKKSLLTLPVALCELDLDLSPAHPLPVQAVQGVFGVPDVLERATAVKDFVHFSPNTFLIHTKI